MKAIVFVMKILDIVPHVWLFAQSLKQVFVVFAWT